MNEGCYVFVCQNHYFNSDDINRIHPMIQYAYNGQNDYFDQFIRYAAIDYFNKRYDITVNPSDNLSDDPSDIQYKIDKSRSNIKKYLRNLDFLESYIL